MTAHAATFPDLVDEDGLVRLAGDLSATARGGDLIALWGDLGAGKTTFARAFIRARAARAGISVDEVPSPTFTLVQIYELPGGPIWHFDLYRLTSADEIWELGFEDALAGGISLIEWPERMGPLLPARRTDLSLEFAEASDLRRVTVTQCND
jgi:tRNA threonylcarbamoyladenosine biosynthesis protein TsaE